MKHEQALAKLGKLQERQKHFSKTLCDRAFKIYEQMEEVNKILSNLECCEGGEYTIEDGGMLAYQIEVPKHLRDLPFINDYLTKDFGHMTGKAHNDLWLCQCVGDYIAVNWNHERGQYFVYDSATGKPLIEKNETWMAQGYVSAVIELYQQERGEFNDIIEINARYGYYEMHYSTVGFADKSIEDLKTYIKNIEDKNQEEQSA